MPSQSSVSPQVALWQACYTDGHSIGATRSFAKLDTA
jgi:hypothetical protein